MTDESQGHYLKESIGAMVNSAMNCAEIALLVSKMGDVYPNEKTRQLARELADELTLAFVDRMLEDAFTKVVDLPIQESLRKAMQSSSRRIEP
jgi:uncharacterized protein (DUF697 family)